MKKLTLLKFTALLKILCRGFTLLCSRTVFSFLLFFTIMALTVTAVFPQTGWVKYEKNPVLDLGPSGSWDSKGAEMGTVLFDGSLYHMWYCGNDGINFLIGHAVSPDGIDWMKDTLNPVLVVGTAGSWDDFGLFSPCVLLRGSTFHIWYDGSDGYNERVGHATSTDGSNWTKDTLNPVIDLGVSGSWEDMQVFPLTGSVIYDDSIYKMWYGGLASGTFVYSTGYATSPDGSVWAKDTVHNPVMTAGSQGEWDRHSVLPGTILFDGVMYHNWYSGCSNNYRWRIGYATSTDGINWIKDTVNNPVVDFGSIGSWDNKMAFDGSVIFDSTSQTYMMWYMGGEFSTGRIGYASCLVTGVNDNEISDRFMLLQNYPNPFTTSTTIAYELEQPATVQITIYNHLGKQIEVIEKRQPQGLQKVVWSPQNQPNGIYYIKLRAGGQVASGKVVLAR